MDYNINQQDFKNYLITQLDNVKTHQNNAKGRKKQGVPINLFCDIETFTANRDCKHKSHLQSYTYSFAIAWWNTADEVPYWCVFNNFTEFFNLLHDLNKEHKKFKYLDFNLWFHNGNKYDNHFLEEEISREFNIPIKSAYVNNSGADVNATTVKERDLTDEDFEGIILEQRIRSGNQCQLKIYFEKIKIECIDTYPKMNEPLRQVGKRLLNNGLISEEYLKTDYNYTQYDLNEKITVEHAKAWSKRIYDSLSDDELLYIRNDVILLAYAVKHYSDLFYGFDISKMTFTQNIKELYAEVNPLAEFQLLKTYYKQHLSYSDYQISGLTGFDYLRRFYKGGLNAYNDIYVGKTINEKGFSMDLNSSYPTVMYKEKLPTFLSVVVDHHHETQIEYKNKNKMTFFVMTYDNANKYVISKIPSITVRNMIVKYYNTKNGLVYYNSVFVELLNTIFGIELGTIPVESLTVWDCEYFGARSEIARNYFIKTQGKMKNALDCTPETIDPTNIVLTDKPKPKEYDYDDSMVQASKVLLNGIYGVPALRACFNIFVRNEAGELVNYKDGFHNKERNIIFSAGVTAFAFRNLLTPLKYLTPEEIDEWFWYCDTDSLYMNAKALEKMDKSIFHPMNLGGWDIEHKEITSFYPFNHKKYCLYDPEEGIVVRCGGVNKEQIAQWIAESDDNIDYFINHYFRDGVVIKAQRSIRNTMGTISIYEADAELQQGYAYDSEYNLEKEKMLEVVKSIIREELDDKQFTDTNPDSSQLLYVETPFGAFGDNDLREDTPVTNQQNAILLVQAMQAMKNILC